MVPVQDKYHAIAVASEVLPPLSNVVGVTLASIDDKQKNFVRAVIRARRAAVNFMEENTAEAGDIVAKHYNIPLEVARSTVNNLIKSRRKAFRIGARARSTTRVSIAW